MYFLKNSYRILLGESRATLFTGTKDIVKSLIRLRPEGTQHTENDILLDNILFDGFDICTF